jgi:hypothetical protein
MSECVCCKETRKVETVRVPETIQGTGEMFDYERCARCGSLQIAAIPDDLSRYYSGDYYSFKKRHARTPDRLRDIARKRVARLLVGKGSSSELLSRALLPAWGEWFQGFDDGLAEPILDVGCGKGALLSELGRYGFSRLEGLDAFLAEDAVLPNGVRLEHMVDPLAQLEHARRLLAPGGRVAVRVPLVGGSWDRYGVAFNGLAEAPRHLFVPTANGMLILGERAGLRCERTRYDGNGRHVLQSRGRAVTGMASRGQSEWLPSRLDRWRARTDAWRQNRSGRGDAATFLFRAR